MVFTNKNVLVTGSAGFIGFHMASRLLKEGWNVIGIDNFNSYYDEKLKRNRHKILNKFSNFIEIIGSIENKILVEKIFKNYNPKILIHLAAQAGVRYSLENPEQYLNSNILGTFTIIEALKNYNVEHFLYASTSSVYGNSIELPYTEITSSDFPLSFYAATKKATEALIHSYSHLFKIPTTIFRFFTVYGPWGRPDMALFKFTKAIINNEEIKLFNNGDMKRDFTYIDDLIESVYRLINIAPELPSNRLKIYANDSISDVAPWRVVNIGNSKTIELIDFVKVLESHLKKQAKIKKIEQQPGEVYQTHASSDLLQSLIKFKPNTDINFGIPKYLDWYKKFYKKF